jgi:hypothetical protein
MTAQCALLGGRNNIERMLCCSRRARQTSVVDKAPSGCRVKRAAQPPLQGKFGDSLEQELAGLFGPGPAAGSTRPRLDNADEDRTDGGGTRSD